MLDRLLRKAQPVDDPARLKRGMEAAASLAAIKGNPMQALAEARALLQDYEAGPGHLDGLARSLELLDDLDLRSGSIRLDFGLARELAYYTGIIFEVTVGENGTSLGGGGRYDGLARALGSPSDLPALGFAYSLEAVLEQIGASDDKNSRDEATRYIWPTGDLAYRKALALASEMRAHGHPAVVEVCPRDLQGAIVFARSQGYSSVLAVDADGATTTYPAG
jgi:histidyl-tRNA synthetase